MKKFLFLIVLLILGVSCSNSNTVNVSRDNSKKEDSTKHLSKNPVYVKVKRDFKREGVWDDTILKVGRTTVKVSMSRISKGDYAIPDTLCANDTCWVSLYKELVLHIKMKSSQENEIVFDRSILGKNFKGIDSNKGLIDMTEIDSVNNKTKEIFFTTHVAMSGGGYDIIYSIDLNGNLKIISKVETLSVQG